MVHRFRIPGCKGDFIESLIGEANQTVFTEPFCADLFLRNESSALILPKRHRFQIEPDYSAFWVKKK